VKRLAALVLLGLLACSRQPEPSPQPQATAPPSPAASPTASPAPQPSPVATPTIAPTAPPPSPQATPTPTYRFVFTPPPTAPPPPGAPQILEIDVTDQTVHQNSDVAVRVLTSPSVATVVAAAMGREVAIPQVGSGLFEAQSHIPGVPFFFLNRTFNIEIRAATADGQTSRVTLPIRLVR
jgi:hypothetical protein